MLLTVILRSVDLDVLLIEDLQRDLLSLVVDDAALGMALTPCLLLVWVVLAHTDHEARQFTESLGLAKRSIVLLVEGLWVVSEEVQCEITRGMGGLWRRVVYG